MGYANPGIFGGRTYKSFPVFNGVIFNLLVWENPFKQESPFDFGHYAVTEFGNLGIERIPPEELGATAVIKLFTY